MKTSIIERPASTLTKHYLENKAGIYRWRKENAEAYKTYNREYQRKRRANPEKYQELKARCDLRAYLSGRCDTSYKTISRLGMKRKEIASKCDMTEAEFIKMLKTHEIDHILSTSWFNKPENERLKPFMYRHYNIQFVPKATNRSKHSWVDETDMRVQYVLKMMELDYLLSCTEQTATTIFKMHDLNNVIMKLNKQIKKQYQS